MLVGLFCGLDRGGVEPVEFALEDALLAGLAAAVKQGEQHLGCLAAFLVDGLDDGRDSGRGEIGSVLAVESQKADLLWEQMSHGLKRLIDTGERPLVLHEDERTLGGIELVLKVLGELVN